MIQCKDLSIGSFVRFLKDDGTLSDPLEVSDLYHENATLIPSGEYIDDSFYVFDYEMMPIPITGEILEKNGWSHKNGYWTKKGPVRLSWKENGFELIAGFWTLPVAIEHVHQLQNVVRLLGLEEMVI